MKKSRKANVERFRFIFFCSGLILSMLAIIFAFDIPVKSDFKATDEIEIEDDWEIAPESLAQKSRKRKEIKKPFRDKSQNKGYLVKPVERNIPDSKDESPVLDNFSPVVDDPFSKNEIADKFENTKEEILPPYAKFEVETGFPGGNAEMQRFIRKNFEYPDEVKNMTIDTTLYIKFVVREMEKLMESSLKTGHLIRALKKKLKE